MAGQLMVRAIELAPEDGAPGTVNLTRAHVRNEADAFLGLPWKEAVDFFAAKQIIEPDEFEDIDDRFKAGGFAAKSLASDALVARAKVAIEKQLREGSTIESTVKAIRGDALSLGLTTTRPWAVELVARNAVSGAYGFGRYHAQNDPDIRELRPYMRYLTAGDTEVRPNHAAMDGLVVEVGTELADRIAPPAGHACRCSSMTVSRDMLRERGWTVSTALPPGGYPDIGWEGRPAPLTA